MRALIARAQAMCDADGRTRWVNYTSLGWRIELAPLDNSEVSFRITPDPKEA
jgi:hypothetical protein